MHGGICQSRGRGLCPVELTVVGGNDALDSAPELVNKDAQGGGWMVQFTPADASSLSALMDQAAYDALEK